MIQRHRIAYRLLGLLILFGGAVVFATAGAAPNGDAKKAADQPHWRYPVAQAITLDGKTLLTANERSGTISIVDLESRTARPEQLFGKSLADIETASDGRILIVDSKRHLLSVCRFEGGGLKADSQVEVSSYPVDIEISDDAQRAYVASLWSRRLTEVTLGDKPGVARTLDLPFAPRRQLLLEDRERLLVADSFSGRLAVVDLKKFVVESVRDFPGHNIRGFASSPNGEMLLLSHQMLNELAHTVRSDVHWGLLMSNDLRWLKTDIVLDSKQKIYSESHMHPLGEAGSATGDPARLDISDDGVVVVALAGVNEVAMGRERDFSLKRIRVGLRPTSVVIDDERRAAYVANTFGDSITVIDLDKAKAVETISLGGTPELTQRDRGERLFFNAQLSHDAWMSCHSCHTDGHTNGMLNDNLSDATFGAPKRVMTLMGKKGTEPLAWNASAKSLEEQVRNSIIKTMQKDSPPTDEQVEALAAFVRSLPPPPPVDVARGEFDAEAVQRGKAAFVELKCARCHEPPLYTTPKTYDVGIHDQIGNKHFNPPTLIGVGQRGPFFHDNRAKSLTDVFSEFGHQLDGKTLTESQLRDLVAFLRSL